MKVLTQILNRFSGALIFEAEVEGENKPMRLGLAAVMAIRAHANLEGADLDGADLDGADLRRANLRRANLEGANLDGADLDGADLRRANLRRANLRHANLRRANLEEANLDGADLDGADLDGADLEEANLDGADLRRANLRHANLKGANLEEADLDFSSGFTFRCTSFGFKCDFRLIAQIMCHVARLESDDPKAREIIEEVRHRWGDEFCKFRGDVFPINSTIEKGETE